MNAVWGWIVRALLIIVCVFLTAWSVRMAAADLRAQRNGIEGIEAAIKLEPGDSVLLARAALMKNDGGDLSPAVDRDFRHAAEADPLNADLPMALGLREEFRGDMAGAERDLVRATEIDHTFKPAWTLANFYVRNNQADKSWPLIRRALNLNPLAFDPTPVFDLCWNQTNDSKKILDLMPASGVVPLQYLYYLGIRKRFDAAMEYWPHAFAAADPADPGHVEVLNAFTESLIQADRTANAVQVWNQLIDRGIVASGKLDPAAGVSIANPDFSFPLNERGFSWRATHDAGVSVSATASSLRFEFDGNEAESILLLSTVAPLVPGREYRAVWKTDASHLSSPRDAGFLLQIVQEPGNVASECQPILESGDSGVCRFTSRPDAASAHINFLYKRALGTTRVQGAIEIARFRLEFGS